MEDTSARPGIEFATTVALVRGPAAAGPRLSSTVFAVTHL
jgi:hypothetical protein